MQAISQPEHPQLGKVIDINLSIAGYVSYDGYRLGLPFRRDIGEFYKVYNSIRVKVQPTDTLFILGVHHIIQAIILLMVARSTY